MKFSLLFLRELLIQIFISIVLGVLSVFAFFMPIVFLTAASDEGIVPILATYLPPLFSTAALFLLGWSLPLREPLSPKFIFVTLLAPCIFAVVISGFTEGNPEAVIWVLLSIVAAFIACLIGLILNYRKIAKH